MLRDKTKRNNSSGLKVGRLESLNVDTLERYHVSIRHIRKWKYVFGKVQFLEQLYYIQRCKSRIKLKVEFKPCEGFYRVES